MPSCAGAKGLSALAKFDVLGKIEELLVRLDIENVQPKKPVLTLNRCK